MVNVIIPSRDFDDVIRPVDVIVRFFPVRTMGLGIVCLFKLLMCVFRSGPHYIWMRYSFVGMMMR